MTMKLQFAHQDYQKKAVDAVVKVFDGQPLAKGDFALAVQQGSVAYAGRQHWQRAEALGRATAGQCRRCKRTMAWSHLPLWPSLPAQTMAKRCFALLNFTIEMETGTGKTYTKIKTMYELNKVYGFKKFVVVVPSVAIREGTMKNLQITRSHFAADYANVPCVPILYDSTKLTDLRHFAQSDALSVLVINIDSFTKDNNKINQKGERRLRPLNTSGGEPHYRHRGRTAKL